MSQLRSDIWCAAFVRRHNDLGHLCVISRKGDPIAGQIWVEVDHLDGTVSLYAPAPSVLMGEDNADRAFEARLQRDTAARVAARMAREADFDPDFWLLTLETRARDTEIGLTVVPAR